MPSRTSSLVFRIRFVGFHRQFKLDDERPVIAFSLFGKPQICGCEIFVFGAQASHNSIGFAPDLGIRVLWHDIAGQRSSDFLLSEYIQQRVSVVVPKAAVFALGHRLFCERHTRVCKEESSTRVHYPTQEQVTGGLIILLRAIGSSPSPPNEEPTSCRRIGKHRLADAALCAHCVASYCLPRKYKSRYGTHEPIMADRRELYSSPNGDLGSWSRADNGRGLHHPSAQWAVRRTFVPHELGEFMRLCNGPEQQALLRLIGTLVAVPPYA